MPPSSAVLFGALKTLLPAEQQKFFFDFAVSSSHAVLNQAALRNAARLVCTSSLWSNFTDWDAWNIVMSYASSSQHPQLFNPVPITVSGTLLTSSVYGLDLGFQVSLQLSGSASGSL